MDLNRLRSHLQGKVTIICHHNADPDAVCAAFALKELIIKLDPKATIEILFPDSASHLSGKIIKSLKITISNTPKIKQPDTIIVVDTGSLAQLENLSTFLLDNKTSKIFIDHHTKDQQIEQFATMYLIDENAIATCEIIYNLWKTYNILIPKDVANALLTGVFFDSKHFSIGSSVMFNIVANLLERGANLIEVREYLTTTIGQSEKIARLKACQRMLLYRFDPWIIVTSNVSSFQSSVARSVLNLGADVAIVAGNDKNEIKSSMRSSEDFYEKTGIHLGEGISKTLAEEYNGAGGGHSTAAGISCYGNTELFLKRAVELLAIKIRK